MDPKIRIDECESVVIVEYKGGRSEVRKVKGKVQYGGQPTATRAEVEEFLRKRREGKI
jgi:hypothetical protein